MFKKKKKKSAKGDNYNFINPMQREMLLAFAARVEFFKLTRNAKTLAFAFLSNIFSFAEVSVI